jgi:hypothetical protein
MLLWKCPRCGTDNTGPLSDGCTTCGSGGAKPRHVGVQPPQRVRITPVDDDRTEAFDRWMASHPPEWGKLRQFLSEAWMAAWAEAQRAVEQRPAASEARVVIVPHAVLVRVIVKLQTVTDEIVDRDGEAEAIQSEALLALIAELQELAE